MTCFNFKQLCQLFKKDRANKFKFKKPNIGRSEHRVAQNTLKDLELPDGKPKQTDGDEVDEDEADTVSNAED